MSLTFRLAILLFVLVGVQVVSSKLMHSNIPHGVELPPTDLEELPRTLGDWVCSATLDAAIAREVAGMAQVSLHRAYESAAAVPVSTYVGLWTEYDTGLPHPPTDCYPNAGNEIIDSKVVSLKRPDGTVAKAHILHLEANDQPGHLLYWYQLEQQIIWNSDQRREATWVFHTRSNWPPMIKVMLDIRGVDKETAERLLTDLGEELLQWTSTTLQSNRTTSN